jgi:RimJ/RimL family protein N-acetyltransferase
VVNVYEIRTERLLMRRWRRADQEPFAALNADPEVMRHFPSRLDRVQSDTAVDRYEELFERNGFGLWALERLEDGAFLGFTGLNAMPEGVPGEGDQEVGWRLAQHAWHHGYATEAARAAVGAAFGPLRLTRVWSMTAVTNRPSQAVMQRIGMHEHGVFDHPRIKRGHALRPHVVYRLDATAPAR